MNNTKIYSKREIYNLVKNIPKIIVIDFGDKIPKEKFKQLKLDGDFVPYIISSYGRIFSINYKHITNNVVRLKTTIDEYGYEFVVIHYNNKSYGMNVHRAVALNFIKNKKPKTKTQVNHKNGNKLFNVAYNLEWVTPKENIEHAWKNKLAKSYGINNGNNVYSEEDIRNVCSLLEKNVSFKEIENITGVSYAMISLVYRKKFWIKISDNYNFENYNYGKS